MVASAAALPGVFLILRNVAMISDAISHSVLFGIVCMFFIVQDIHSPLLLVAAAATGLLTVVLTQLLIQSNRMKQDAAIGLVFPLLFAIAIVFINMFAGNIHLDQDAVLLGEIAFAPFRRWIAFGIDLGPISMWVMGVILFINATFISLFFKELILSSFDSNLAAAMGFSPTVLTYGLMFCVSITAVGAFDSVGSILIVTFMITPSATAYLLTHSIPRMIGYSIGLGCASAILGVGLALLFDASIAGAMCSISGCLFLLALLFSNHHGLLLNYYTYKKQQLRFCATLLTVQLLGHENTKQQAFEHSFSNLVTHMKWSIDFSKKVISYAQSVGMITKKGNQFFLTDLGRETAKNSFTIT